MSRYLTHAIILIIAVGGGFLFAASQLGRYDLFVIAAVFLGYFLLKKIFSRAQQTHLIDGVVFSFIITVLIQTTGGLQSKFFFLIYFLLFSLSILLEPAVSATTSLTFVFFYLIATPGTRSFSDLIPLFSLPFLTPFALFLGEEYLKVQQKNNQIRILNTRMGKKQEENLLFMSLVIKNHLSQIGERVDNFTGDHDLKVIGKNVARLKDLIDRFENQKD